MMKAVYFCPISHKTHTMLLVLALLGFYLCSLWLAFAFTLAQQALVQGVGLCAVAAVAVLTLWLLVKTGFVEPWLSIALSGAIALPAVMIGLGLALGGLLRITRQNRDWTYGLTCLGAGAPAILGVLAAFAV